MAQGSPQNINEFRVMATSMEKIMNRIQAKKQSRKLGRYTVSTIHRIQPSTRQCDNAEKVLYGLAAASTTTTATATTSRGKNTAAAVPSTKKTSVSIPMFFIKGMVIKRTGVEVREYNISKYNHLYYIFINIIIYIIY